MSNTLKMVEFARDGKFIEFKKAFNTEIGSRLNDQFQSLKQQLAADVAIPDEDEDGE